MAYLTPVRRPLKIYAYDPMLGRMPIHRITLDVLNEPLQPGPRGSRVEVIDYDGVVVTHRHLDHVSGFALKGWNEVEVGEVWMPWTEDPADPDARRICERQSMRALQLQSIIPQLNLAPERAKYLLEYAGNNLTNAAAMAVLHEGFLGRPKRHFLPSATGSGNLIASEFLPGIEVHVLGPSRSEDVIRDMDPPHAESFFRAASVTAAANQKHKPPFSGCWILDRNGYEDWYAARNCAKPLEDFTEDTARHFRKLMQSPETELAAALEKSVNGTSLVLLFKVGRAVLLFPGDAQWGTWNEIMRDERYQRLLKNVSFYKVGHHGSHNATPKRFVQELLPDDAYAMVPTDKVNQWPMIPKRELIDYLRTKGVRFVRSDIADAADDPCFRRHQVNGHTRWIDLDVPTD